MYFVMLFLKIALIISIIIILISSLFISKRRRDFLPLLLNLFSVLPGWIAFIICVSPITTLTATPSGINKVTLSWDNKFFADGYVVFRVIDGTPVEIADIEREFQKDRERISFVDTQASETQFNTYIVYAYCIDTKGLRKSGEPGKCKAKGVLPAVSDLQAVTQNGTIHLTWNPVPEADAYEICRSVGDDKVRIHIYTTTRTDYWDTSASKNEFNFYRVYPLHKLEDGSGYIRGDSNKYVYAKSY